MASSPIEYVTLGETIADIALKEKASASLTAVPKDAAQNLVSILHQGPIFADVVLIMFLSLLCLSNGRWSLGDALCKVNAWTQNEEDLKNWFNEFFESRPSYFWRKGIDQLVERWEQVVRNNGERKIDETVAICNSAFSGSEPMFIFLKSLLTLMLMAMERAIGLLGKHLVTPKHFTILSLMFTFASMCFALPTLLPNFYVHAHRFRYLCAIGSKTPVVYTIIQILVYGGCLFVLLICFGSLLTYRIDTRSLPNKPQDYSSFIIESRALQDHLVMGRLVLFMTLVPVFYLYKSLFILFWIRNSGELLAQYDNVEFEIPQDVDTTITWLRFFFPLITPLLTATLHMQNKMLKTILPSKNYRIMILGNCHDIWTKFINLMCCRRNTSHLFGAWGHMNGTKGSTSVNPDNVLTLVATTDGLQLRVPNNYNQTIHDNSYQQFQQQLKEQQIQELHREHIPTDTFEPEYDSRSKIVEFERVKEEERPPNVAENQTKSKMYNKQENIAVHNNSSATSSRLRKPRIGRDKKIKNKRKDIK